MTYAEEAELSGKRDDEHMIYEMFQFSQYEDGSVFDCWRDVTHTSQEIADGMDVVGNENPKTVSVAKNINRDLRRNAKAALKNGTSTNLAPRVKP